VIIFVANTLPLFFSIFDSANPVATAKDKKQGEILFQILLERNAFNFLLKKFNFVKMFRAKVKSKMSATRAFGIMGVTRWDSQFQSLFWEKGMQDMWNYFRKDLLSEQHENYDPKESIDKALWLQMQLLTKKKMDALKEKVSCPNLSTPYLVHLQEQPVLSGVCFPPIEQLGVSVAVWVAN